MSKYGGSGQSRGSYSQPSKQFSNKFSTIPESPKSAWAGPSAAEKAMERLMSGTATSDSSFTPMSYSMIDKDEQSILGRGYLKSNDVTLEGVNSSNISWRLPAQEVSLFNPKEPPQHIFAPGEKPPSPILKPNSPKNARKSAKSPVVERRQINTLEDLLDEVRSMAQDIPLSVLAKRLLTPLDNRSASTSSSEQARRALPHDSSNPKISSKDARWLLDPEDETTTSSRSPRRSNKENYYDAHESSSPPSSVSQNYSRSERNIRSPTSKGVQNRLAPEDSLCCSRSESCYRSRTPSPRAETHRSFNNTTGGEELLRRYDALALDMSYGEMVDRLMKMPGSNKERLAKYNNRIDVPSTRAILAQLDNMPKDMSPCTMVDKILSLPANSQRKAVSPNGNGRRSVPASGTSHQHVSRPRSSCGDVSHKSGSVNSSRTQRSTNATKYESQGSSYDQLLVEQMARRERQFAAMSRK